MSYTFSGISLCRGVDLTSWKENLQQEAKPADLANFVRHLSENHVFPNKVLVDCTADANVASHYYDWLKKGIHVITPNKKANSGPLDQVNIFGWLNIFLCVLLILK
jgi:aspartokinase/homoserine dehydrogenase 1